MGKFTYFDSAATTCPTPAVLKKVSEYASNMTKDPGYYANPSSIHAGGKLARSKVEDARKSLKNLIGALAQDELIFTSGGSESDNLMIRGVMPSLLKKGKDVIITSPFEHHAVYHTIDDLDYECMIEYVNVLPNGIIDLDHLKYLLDLYNTRVGLVCIMAVNNEIGSIQPVREIGILCHKYKAIFATDAVQAFGHIPVNVQKMHVDMLSFSGHKFHALKGIGALYVKKGIKLEPQITGGGQEKKLRSGTENVLGIETMAAAANEIYERFDEDTAKAMKLRQTLSDYLTINCVDFKINANDNCIPTTISLTLPGCESEAVVIMLNERGFAVSSGSACSAGSLESSATLKAIGLSDSEIHSTIRISFDPYYIGSRDIEKLAVAIVVISRKLRTIGPGLDS